MKTRSLVDRARMFIKRNHSDRQIIVYPGFFASTDFKMLRSYFRALSEHHKSLIRQYGTDEEDKIWKELGNLGNDEERRQLYGWCMMSLQVEVDAITRSAWSSFLVMIWATFENNLKKLVKWVEQQPQTTLSDADRGCAAPRSGVPSGKENVLERNMRVLMEKGVCNPLTHGDWSFLENLYLIRNAFAHGDGSIDIANQPALREFVGETEGLELSTTCLSEPTLEISQPFVSKALDIVTRAFSQLDEQVEQKFFPDESPPDYQ